jgi:hypothetical protein
LAIIPTLFNVCNAISDCGNYGAQVTCLLSISQGATGCAEIQIYDKDLARADLSKFKVIQIIVTDVGNNVVAIFSEPQLIGSYVDAGLEIQTDGLIKCCFTAEMTSNSMSGRLMAEMKLVEEVSTGQNPEVFIIKCIQIGTIKQSFFSLGFTADGISPDNGGGGTTGTGTSGTSGTSGISTNGTSGTSGFGTSGTSGVSGTGGFLADWELENEISIGANEQLTFSGDYVLEDTLMLIEASGTEIEYSLNKYFKKIGKIFIGGNLLIKDSLLVNNGLVSVGGEVILIGNSQITGTGTII